MQEIQYDGTETLTRLSDIKAERDAQIKRAMENQKNAQVKVFNVGAIITHSDGTQYKIQENGSWKKVQP